METPLATAGWYGKLPSLGDFASRRLDPDFIETWDDWLASGLAGWQSLAPEAWLERYLAGPTWRFVLMPGALPGACGDIAWAGVLMPSVDRVGRYFPLTLAHPVARLPAPGPQTDAMLAWLHRLDDLAVDALHEDWSVERLEVELLAAPAPEVAHSGTPPIDWSSSTFELRPGTDVSAFLAALGGAQLHALLHARTLWLSDDAQGQPRLRVHAGLPRGDEFVALMGSADVAAPFTST